MNNLECRKQKFNGKFECKRTGKEISLSQCTNCKYKEYKLTTNYGQLKKSGVLEKNKKKSGQSNKLANLERKRKSILAENLEHCIICGGKKEHLHEIYFGKNRLNSIKYDLVIPVCFSCHTRIHNNIDLDLFYKKKGQQAFIIQYPKLDFIDIFKKNYL